MIRTKTKRNYFYAIIKELVDIAVPFVLVPYSSRILGAEGIGKYSFVYSIIYYFMIVAMLGLNNYGTREIAKQQASKERCIKKFTEIYSLQIISCSTVAAIFFITAFFPGNNYWMVFLAQACYILSCFFDISWFYTGIEKFKSITIYNTIAKVISLLLVLVFVKTNSDLLVYCIILSASLLFGNLMLWIHMKRKTKWNFTKSDFYTVLTHLKPCLLLFIPVIAMKIYKVMDKTALGMMSSMDEVGYYSNADSIINVPMGIVIALGVVMLPRLTNLISNKSHKAAEIAFKKSIEFGIFIITPIMFGLIVLGPSIAVLFLGKDFIRTGLLLQILAVIMLFMTIANVVRMQILIPRGKDKEFSFSVIVGAIVNIIGNIILIPFLGAVGACISTIIAEFLVMAYSVYYAKDFIDLKFVIKRAMVALATGGVMALIVFLVRTNLKDNWLNLFIEVGVGVVVYFILNSKNIIRTLNAMSIRKEKK